MPVSERITIARLCDLFDLPEFDSLDDASFDYYCEAGQFAYDYAIAHGEDEDEAERQRDEAEQETREEVFSQWHSAVESAVEAIFEVHGLGLSPVGEAKYPFEYDVRPETTWENAANEVRKTINGVGYFYFDTLGEFLDSGPHDAREAVLCHLHWLKDQPEVYGEPSASRRYEQAFR